MKTYFGYISLLYCKDKPWLTLLFTLLELGLIVTWWHLVMENMTRMAVLSTFLTFITKIRTLNRRTLLPLKSLYLHLTDQAGQPSVDSIIEHDLLAWSSNLVCRFLLAMAIPIRSVFLHPWSLQNHAQNIWETLMQPFNVWPLYLLSGIKLIRWHCGV